VSLEQRRWSAQGAALRHVRCNLCGADEPAPLTRENGLCVVRCRHCGLVYVTPRPTRDALARFYDAYYATEHEADWHRVMRGLFERDAARVEAARPCTGGGRLVDLGTGFGHFLDGMRARGWQVAAVEGAAAAAERLRARGIELYFGTSPEVALPQRRFDAAVASSVLEHVDDPVGVLRQIHDALRPGGLALVRVPNLDLFSLFLPLRRFEQSAGCRALLRVLRREIMDEENLFHVIDPPGHLYGFTRRTLAAAMQRAGFREIRIEGDPMPRRGSALNAWIDGGVFRGARVLRALSAGRLELSPYVTALARR
jgi:SAM-dependent methyltransferase